MGYSPASIVAASASLTVLAVFIVALRFFTRWSCRIGICSDDFVILAAVIICTGGGISTIIAASIGGLGAHQQLGPNGELIHTDTLYIYEKTRYVTNFLTTLNLGLVKISILLFYRRIFVHAAFRTASTIMLVIMVGWTIAFGVTMTIQCVPVSDFWNVFEMDYGSNCVRVQKLYEALAWSDLALDIVVLMLPVPIVCLLHMPWRKKIAVIDILLLGIIVLGSGVARLTSFLHVIDETRNNPVGYFHDTPWWTAGPLFWTYAENPIAIIGACLPTLAPLWTRHIASLTSKVSDVTSSFKKTSANDSHDASYNTRSTKRWSANSEAEAASLQKLACFTPSATVCAERIPSDEQLTIQGIHVETTFSVERELS